MRRGRALLVWKGGANRETFWKKFDETFQENRDAVPIDALTLELIALRHGKHGDRFLQDLNRYLAAREPRRLGLLFQKEIEKLSLPTRETVQQVEWRRAEREERLEMIRMNLPAAFSRQPREIRFLLRSFLKHLPDARANSLIAEMRALQAASSDAEVFCHFFKRTGLEKAGQFLSTLVGLVPDEDRKIYAELQDDVPASSLSELRGTIEREIGKPIHKVFSEWNDVAVAVASMGEVHWGRRRSDSTEIVAKVITPSKRANVTMAIAALRGVAEDYEKNQRRFSTPLDVVEELRNFADQLQAQVHFDRERRNAAKSDGVRYPEYDYDLSTESLNVMQVAPGVKATNLEDPAERRKAAAAYAQQALAMLFREGYFHGDPHPGNVFWEENTGILTWLDWGVVENISKEDRVLLSRLLVATQIGNPEMMTQAMMEAASDFAALGALRQSLEQNPLQSSNGARLQEFLHRASQHRIWLRPPIMRAVAYLLIVQGVVHDLDPARDFSEDVGRAMM